MQNLNDPNTNQVSSLLNLESVIHRTVNDIEKMKNEIRSQKEMYDSSIENDAGFEAQMKKEEEVKKVTAGLKQQLLKSPAIQEASEKLKELKEDMKSLTGNLSDLLKQYQKESGTNIITKEDGTLLEIVATMKLVKKKA